MYTWYVNSNFDIQVYEGKVSQIQMYDFKSALKAEQHIIEDEFNVDYYKNLYARCKYYIPSQFAGTFFTLIGIDAEYAGYVFNFGTTKINVSDFLD